MLNILRMVRLGVDAARWAAPHVQDWKRQRNFNELEAWRNLESKNWGEAEKHFSLALEEPRHGDAKRLEFLLGLAEAQRKQAKFVAAEGTARKAVELATHSKNHPSRLAAMDVLVGLHLEHNKVADARQVAEEIVQLEQSRSRPDNSSLVRQLRRLGDVCLQQKEYEKAEEVFENSVKLAEQSFGSDHPETADSLAGLGRSLRQVGKHNDAQLFLRGALEIHRATRGQDSREVSDDLYQLAGSLEDSGSVESAMAEYEKALALRERQVGVNPEETAALKIHLGSLYLETGRSSAAREMLIHAMRVLEKSGDDRYLQALDVMARAEDHAGRGKEADRLREKAKQVAATRGTQRATKTYDLVETLSVATPAPMTTPPSLWREPSPVRPPTNSVHPEPSDVRLFKPRTLAQPAAYSAELEQTFQVHAQRTQAHGQARTAPLATDYGEATQDSQHVPLPPARAPSDFSDFYRSPGAAPSRPDPAPHSGYRETAFVPENSPAYLADSDGLSSLSRQVRTPQTVISPTQHAESAGRHTTYIAVSEPIGESSSYIITQVPAQVAVAGQKQTATLLAALSQQARSHQPAATPISPPPAEPSSLPSSQGAAPLVAAEARASGQTPQKSTVGTLPPASSPSTVDLTTLREAIGDSPRKPNGPLVSAEQEAGPAAAHRQIPLAKPSAAKPPISRNRFVREGNDTPLPGPTPLRPALRLEQKGAAHLAQPELQSLLALPPRQHSQLESKLSSSPASTIRASAINTSTINNGIGNPISLFPPAAPAWPPDHSLSKELLAQVLVPPNVFASDGLVQDAPLSSYHESPLENLAALPSAVPGAPQIQAKDAESVFADILPSFAPIPSIHSFASGTHSDYSADPHPQAEANSEDRTPNPAPFVALPVPEPVDGALRHVAAWAGLLSAAVDFLRESIVHPGYPRTAVSNRAEPNFARPSAIRVPRPAELPLSSWTPAQVDLSAANQFLGQSLARLQTPRRITHTHELETAQLTETENLSLALGQPLALSAARPIAHPPRCILLEPVPLHSTGQEFLAKFLAVSSPLAFRASRGNQRGVDEVTEAGPVALPLPPSSAGPAVGPMQNDGAQLLFPNPPRWSRATFDADKPGDPIGQLRPAPALALPLHPAQLLRQSAQQPVVAGNHLALVSPGSSLAPQSPEHSPLQASPVPMPRVAAGPWRDRRQARVAPRFDEDRLILPLISEALFTLELTATPIKIEVKVTGPVAGPPHTPQSLPALHPSANRTPQVPVLLNQTPARHLSFGNVLTSAMVSANGSVHAPSTVVVPPPGFADFTTQPAHPPDGDPMIAPAAVSVPTAARIPGDSQQAQLEPQGRTLYGVRNVEARAWLVRYRDTRVRFPRPNQHKLSIDDLDLPIEGPTAPAPDASAAAAPSLVPYPDVLPTFGSEPDPLTMDDDLPSFE